MDIKVPYLAEGVDSGTVVSILVKVGDQVKKDQTVIELETKKAVAPIPSPAAGTVTKILVKEGDEVAVGQALITITEEGAPAEAESSSKTQGKVAAAKKVQVEKAAVLREEASGKTEEEFKSSVPPATSPSIRKLARELGIDLAKVKGTARGGRILIEDVRAYIEQLQKSSLSLKTSAAQEKPAPVSIDFSKWGPVSRKSLSQLRRAVGEKMSESWQTVPHVTQFDEADITDLMELKKKYSPAYEEKKARLTVSSFVLKVVVDALKKFPTFNSSLDEATRELVLKTYYHIGVAVDTEAGLIVPVLRNADKKNILELSLELAELAEKTRQRKISLDDLQGGTFTISNLGSVGGGHFTPIVNKPEVAILGLGQGSLKPVVKDKKVKMRLMLPVCLSYDHRVVDGADGARFITEIVKGLESFDESALKIIAVKENRKNLQRQERNETA